MKERGLTMEKEGRATTKPTSMIMTGVLIPGCRGIKAEKSWKQCQRNTYGPDGEGS